MIFERHVRIFRYRPAAVLRVSGPDASEFLQGQFTQDLKTVGIQDAAYGLWLNPKGRVEGDSFLLREGESEWILVSYESGGQSIRDRLERHIVADDVMVEDETGGWRGVCVLDIGAEEVRALRERRCGEMVFRGRRGGGECWEWLHPAGGGADADLRGMEEVGLAEMERRRIEAGVPMVPRDVGPGDLPNEAGLERDAISCTKGCYLGQEVMSRLRSLGRVRRRLWRVCWEGASVPGGRAGGGPGAPLTQALPAGLFMNGQKVGELRSMTQAEDDGKRGKCMGLAMLSMDKAAKGALLSWPEEGGAAVRCEFPV